MTQRYKSVWITGASAGLGGEFARQLAGESAKLVLVARRADRLESLAQELRIQNENLEVEVRIVDLSSERERQSLIDEVSLGKGAIDLLVNNAGLGDYGEFVSADWSKMNLMLQVNIVALTHLCHGFLPMMKKGAGVINVSSLASTLPIPDFAAYAATKAYVLSLSEALRIEMKGKGVSVTALCPGPVHTEFGDVAAREEKPVDVGLREMAYVDKSLVVKKAIQALNKNKARVFPGWLVAIMARFFEALPMPIMRVILGRRPRKLS